MHPEQMLNARPHSPMAGTGWLQGWRLTFGGEDIGWEGALATVVEDPGSKVFVVLYDMTTEDEAEPGPLGGFRVRHPQEDPLPGRPRRPRTPTATGAGLAVRRRRLGGRPAVGPLPGRDRRRGRNRRCARPNTCTTCAPARQATSAPGPRRRRSARRRAQQRQTVRRCSSSPAPRRRARARRGRTSAGAGRAADRRRTRRPSRAMAPGTSSRYQEKSSPPPDCRVSVSTSGPTPSMASASMRVEIASLTTGGTPRRYFSCTRTFSGASSAETISRTSGSIATQARGSPCGWCRPACRTAGSRWRPRRR